MQVSHTGILATWAMRPHILFVDDEAPIREMLALYFRKQGYDVSSATTHAEAVALADKNPFHLAILDVDIAGENGLELLSLFKAKYPKLPVIMFTGLNSDEDLLARAMARGADAFMRKTEPIHDLLGEVQRFVPKP